MNQNTFGTSGLHVTALGFGAMHINDERTSDSDAGRLLNQVLDLGINLIDTARGYGLSEERIGRHISHRRQDYVLSTKIGYGIEGVPDWTAQCIVAGVDAALQRMKCERLDIVHLHSCPLHVLQQGDVIRALEACVSAGKVGVAAYAGDNAELDFAINSARFGSVQTSISVCDQVNIANRLGGLQSHGMGVIAKRPIAGAVWRQSTRPDTHAEGHYWDRWQAMGLGMALPDANWNETALRFTAFLPGVSSTIVGTSKIDHLKQNLAAIERGPLPPEQQQQLRDAFAQHGQDWVGLI